MKFWHEGVQCYVQHVIYDYERKHGKLALPAMNCTDMAGCIALFKAIDPDVRIIITESEDGERTDYVLSDGEWEARTRHAVLTQ